MKDQITLSIILTQLISKFYGFPFSKCLIQSPYHHFIVNSIHNVKLITLLSPVISIRGFILWGLCSDEIPYINLCICEKFVNYKLMML